MRLYHSERAPNPRRVRIFLAEKGIDIEYILVDLANHEHQTAGFSAKNPLMRLPVLELDDRTYISESIAICRYFEGLHPEPCLFGRTPYEQAVTEMWNRRIELGLYAHIANAFRHTNPAMADFEKPQISEWGKANAAKIDDALAMIDLHLANSDFIAGDHFSVADISLLVAVDFLRVLRRAIPPHMHALARWHANVSARASAGA